MSVRRPLNTAAFCPSLYASLEIASEGDLELRVLVGDVTVGKNSASTERENSRIRFTDCLLTYEGTTDITVLENGEVFRKNGTRFDIKIRRGSSDNSCRITKPAPPMPSYRNLRALSEFSGIPVEPSVASTDVIWALRTGVLDRYDMAVWKVDFGREVWINRIRHQLFEDYLDDFRAGDSG